MAADPSARLPIVNFSRKRFDETFQTQFLSARHTFVMRCCYATAHVVACATYEFAIHAFFHDHSSNLFGKSTHVTPTQGGGGKKHEHCYTVYKSTDKRSFVCLNVSDILFTLTSTEARAFSPQVGSSTTKVRCLLKPKARHADNVTTGGEVVTTSPSEALCKTQAQRAVDADKRAPFALPPRSLSRVLIHLFSLSCAEMEEFLRKNLLCHVKCKIVHACLSSIQNLREHLDDYEEIAPLEDPDSGLTKTFCFRISPKENSPLRKKVDAVSISIPMDICDGQNVPNTIEMMLFDANGKTVSSHPRMSMLDIHRVFSLAELCLFLDGLANDENEASEASHSDEDLDPVDD